VLTNVDVVDVVEGRLLRGQDVSVRGGRIARVLPHGVSTPEADVQRIDGTGATLVPGYVDMHTHVGMDPAPFWVQRIPDAKANMRSWLYCGVTTVVDIGGLAGQIIALRGDVVDGEVLGPRIRASGPVVSAVGGHPAAILDMMLPWFLRWYLAPRFVEQVDDEQSARRAVDEISDMGADHVKVIVDSIPAGVPRLSPDLVDAVVDEATTRGLPTVAHIGTFEDAVDAAEAGAAAWVHGVYKERLSDDQVATLASYGIPMVPTVSTFDMFADVTKAERVPTPLERETVPADLLEALNDIPEEGSAVQVFAGFLERIAPLRDAWRDNVGRLHGAGVVILAGSDNQAGIFPGPGLHDELAALADSGLAPIEVLRATTLYAARFLEQTRDPSFGIVAEGKQADLVLLDGNPLEDVGALSRIRSVMRNGVVLERMPVAN
jgi:imidazolonepropionase-like amidohydrolase